MPTMLKPAMVTVPAGATFERGHDPDGAPVLMLYTTTGEVAVQIRIADEDAAAALAQGAHAVATAIKEPR